MALFTASEALEMAMEIEKSGEVFYRAVAAQAAEAGLKELFEDLAAQEQMHYLVFQKMAGHKLDANLPAVGVEHDEYQAYLQVALDNALFAGPDKALAAAKKAQDKTSALRAALGFEKDTLLFFYDLRDMVGEADRGALDRIIREEKAHLQRLARML
ncbi:MAG: ferritin family protein [Thermoflexales bacterium]|nr:ferritin family protein [Thermoflexales bacterium]